MTVTLTWAVTPLLRSVNVSLPPSSVQADGGSVTPPFLIVTNRAGTGAQWFLPVALSTRPMTRPRASSSNWVRSLSRVTAGTAALRRDLLVGRLARSGRLSSGRSPLEVRQHFLRRERAVVELHFINQAVMARLRIAPGPDLQITRVSNGVVPAGGRHGFPVDIRLHVRTLERRCHVVPAGPA